MVNIFILSVLITWLTKVVNMNIPRKDIIMEHNPPKALDKD